MGENQLGLLDIHIGQNGEVEGGSDLLVFPIIEPFVFQINVHFLEDVFDDFYPIFESIPSKVSQRNIKVNYQFLGVG